MMYNEIVYKCKTQKCDKIECFTISFNAYQGYRKEKFKNSSKSKNFNFGAR